MTIDELADVLKRRGLDRVCYFHVDHFEPWSFGIDEQSARAVERFAAMARSSPYARRLSLFYCPFISYHLEPEIAGSVDGDRVPGDSILFARRSAAHESLACRTIRPLVREDGHEMHLHVHHEYWTRNGSDFDNPISRWVNAHSTPEADRARLELYFRLCAEVIAGEIAAPFDRWGFIHGNWALAGSDPLICRVDNELSMIMRRGGFGDFSFPAGRGYCDPRLEGPFTCLPLDKVRAYDDPDADPRIVDAGTQVLRPDRFFVWNSPIKSDYSSLDYDAGSPRGLFDAPDRVVFEWLSRSVALDRTLYLKTHAHSVRWQYRLAEPSTLIPHCWPAVTGAFDHLARVCERAGAELKFVTVNEVMSQLSELDSRQGVPAAPVPTQIATQPKSSPPPIRRGRLPGLARELGSALRDWVFADIGRREQAGSFYQQRLGAGEFLASYEWVVLDYLLARFPPGETRVAEIGAGYGLLSLMLAASGYETIAFEGLRPRYEGIEFMVARFEARYPQLRENLRAVRGWFPDALTGAMTAPARRNVLIATNIVNTAAAARQDHILRAAVAFDDLVLDITRFGITRYEPGRADAFRREIGRVLGEVRSVWRHEPNEIWHFRPVPAFDPGAPAAARTIAGTALRSPPRLPGLVVQVDIEQIANELTATERAWNHGDGSKLPNDELYRAKLDRRGLLEPYEIAIAGAIAERFPATFTRMAEIGSGHAGLAILLARRGFVVHGFEGNRARYAACLWHAKDQVRWRPFLEDHLSFTHGMFPVAFDQSRLATDAGNLCIATNITCTYSASRQDAILRALVAFDDVIIDLARFGRDRDSQEERDRFLASLADTYFDPVERLYFSDPYEYWHLRPRPILASQPKPDAGIGAAPQTAAVAPLADPNAAFPVIGEAGVLYAVYGDRLLSACPVCHGTDIRSLWRMPMANLKQPVSLFGGYFNQVPTLETPATVFCFDFCRDCESLFLNPVLASQKQQYRTEDHYIHDMRDGAAWREYEEVYDRLAKWIPPGAEVMVDAACGFGQYLELARRHAAHPWRRLIGLELGESYVADMRRRGLDAHVFDLDADDLAALIGPNQADFICFCEGFEHVAKPLDVVRKLVSVLRPGGRLYFTAQRYGAGVQAAVRPGEPIYIGEKLIRELPQRVGCRIVNATTSNMRYYVVLEK
jgi:SAM-dependent methyltransferase